MKDTIVQITDPEHYWYPALIVVSEVKSFGVQGFCFIVSNDKEPTRTAYIRLRSDQYETVGKAVVVPR